MKRLLATIIVAAGLPAIAEEYQGQLTINPYAPNAISPYEARPNYGGAKLYNSQGEYRGTLNNNQYDAEYVANPYGRYGSKYSSESINNQYSSSGSPYSSESPNNPYGKGLGVYE